VASDFDDLRRVLDDPDEHTRAGAAVRLAELGAPDALDALIRTLDDAADPAHLDMTPAVRALGALGERAIPALLAPLAAEDPLTRLHAQRALEHAVYLRNGFRPGQGFPTADDDRRAGEEVRAIGYAYGAARE
jgi:HEAT repeat protein